MSRNFGRPREWGVWGREQVPEDVADAIAGDFSNRNAFVRSRAIATRIGDDRRFAGAVLHAALVENA